MIHDMTTQTITITKPIEANKEAKDELKRSKRFNFIMMIISIMAMLAAIAGPIVTIIVSR